MRVRLEKDGATLLLDGEPIARGGEAAILTLPDRPGLLAKLYHDPAPEHADKLAAMIAAPPDDPTAKIGHASIAWPAERLFQAEGGRCVGFLMPRVEKAHSLFDVFNPKSRLQTWPLFHYGYLLRTARNLSAAVRALHARGYVLGDLNESNVLVNAQALVTVVDTDSFQVRDGKRTFRCEVGKPEYIAPEIQGADFKQIDRTPEQDAFALAVLIFQLLMQGTHPFAGRFTGTGEQEVLAKRIAAGHWPYARSRRGPYEPNPTAPPFAVLPFPVRELMGQCFESGHDRPSMRPAAADWHRALVEADAELMDCVVNAQHRFHKSLDACPWCELTVKQGRDPFPSKEKVQAKVETAVKATTTVAPPAKTKPTADIAVKPSVAPKATPAKRAPHAGPRNRKRAGLAIPPILLTPWPWVIGLGATALVVLIGLIVTNAHHPTTSVAPGQTTSHGTPPNPIDAPPQFPMPPDPGDGAPVVRDGAPSIDGPVGELVRFEGHTNHINSIVLSADGSRALSGGWDGVLRLWDVPTGKEKLHFAAGVDVVLSVAMSPDGRYALSGGWGNDVSLWDLDSGTLVRPLTGHTDYVRCVAFSPDGRRALSGGADNTMRLWNVETGEVIRTFNGHTDWVTGVAFSPDGKRAVSGCVDHKVRVWDLDGSGAPLELVGHDGPVHGVAFAPSGDRVLSCGDDGTIRIWNVKIGEAERTLAGHNGPVRCVACTPDGRGVLSAGDDGTIRFWDVVAGAEVHRFKTERPVMCVAFGGKDGGRAVSGGDDNLGRLWGLPDPKATPEQIAARIVSPLPPAPPIVRPVPMSDDPAPPVPPIVRNPVPPPPVTATGRPEGQLARFDAHSSVVGCIALSPNGRTLLTGCDDGQVTLWDVEKGESTVCNERHAGPVHCLAFSADGALAASGGDDGIARLWNVKDGSLARTLEGHTYPVLSLSFGAAKTLTTGATMGEPDPDLPDTRTDGMFRVWKTGGADEANELRRYKGPIGPVTCMALLPKQQNALLVGADSITAATTLVLWSMQTGKQLRTFTADGLGVVYGVAASPAGDKAVTTGEDGDVRLWNLASGKELLKFTGHTGAVECAAFSPTGDRLLTGGDDGTVRLWEVATGKELRSFSGHVGAVRAVAFSADGTRAVSGGDDKTARLWDLSK